MRNLLVRAVSSITAMELEDLSDLIIIISDAIKSVTSWIAIISWQKLSNLLDLEDLSI